MPSRRLARHCCSSRLSPDFNPIELAFSKLKALLRAKAIRSAEALWKALGDSAAASVPQSAPTTSAMISSHR